MTSNLVTLYLRSLRAPGERGSGTPPWSAETFETAEGAIDFASYPTGDGERLLKLGISRNGEGGFSGPAAWIWTEGRSLPLKMRTWGRNYASISDSRTKGEVATWEGWTEPEAMIYRLASLSLRPLLVRAAVALYEGEKDENPARRAFAADLRRFATGKGNDRDCFGRILQFDAENSSLNPGRGSAENFFYLRAIGRTFSRTYSIENLKAVANAVRKFARRKASAENVPINPINFQFADRIRIEIGDDFFRELARES